MDRIKQLYYSNSIGGEHATTINGKRACPRMDDLLAVAAQIGIWKTQAVKIASGIKECIYDMLGEYRLKMR